jgi:flagellar biosynthesis protein FlhG
MIKNSIYSNKDAKVIAVTGAKGGVGKTSIAVKLGIEFSRLGKKVLLIDCDYNLSNVMQKLSIPPTNDFSDLINFKKNIYDCLIKKGSFHLLPSSCGNIDFLQNKNHVYNFISEIINEYKKNYDYLILDCPPGLDERVIKLTAVTDYRIVIVTPDLMSITNAYSLIKILNYQHGISFNDLIINRIFNHDQFEKVGEIVKNTTRKFLTCETNILCGFFENRKIWNNIESNIESKSKFMNEIFINILKIFTERDGVKIESAI